MKNFDSFRIEKDPIELKNLIGSIFFGRKYF